MVVPSSDPTATADPGSSEGGETRKLRLDEMLAERHRPSLPPAPVLTVEPAPVDAAPVNGLRGAKKRLAEVEALARHNLRAAEEARRVVHEEWVLLEEEVSARTQAELTATNLRREIERLRSTEEQRAAQAKFAAAHEARAELATEIERVQAEHSKVVDELDRMRGTLFDHDSLLDEYSRKLRDEQEAQARAHGDKVRAEEALRVAERNLEVATESARRRADDDAARFDKVEADWRQACLERDRSQAELRQITMGDGELARLRVDLEAAREDTARLMGELDVQAARADSAESELTEARAARADAEKTAADIAQERELACIAQETMRAELAEKTEALDAERSTSQATIAELTEKLSTATNTAESATERAADLEARLNAAITARDAAEAQVDEVTAELEHARSDADVLRTQAASIGDELAATHAALEAERRKSEESQLAAADAQRAAADARHEAETARADATAAKSWQPPAPEVEPDELAEPGGFAEPVGLTSEATDVPAAPEPESFDSALAAAFGQVAAAEVPAPADDEADDGEDDVTTSAPSRPAFRIVEPLAPRVRSGGPIVDLEASLVRELAPSDPIPDDVEENGDDGETEVAEAGDNGEAAKERKPEPAWRRTAMAELTALATDDDLTPRRRR
jgi:chromosome segregation ATPase